MGHRYSLLVDFISSYPPCRSVFTSVLCTVPDHYEKMAKMTLNNVLRLDFTIRERIPSRFAYRIYPCTASPPRESPTDWPRKWGLKANESLLRIHDDVHRFKTFRVKFAVKSLNEISFNFNEWINCLLYFEGGTGRRESKILSGCPWRSSHVAYEVLRPDGYISGIRRVRNFSGKA